MSLTESVVTELKALGGKPAEFKQMVSVTVDVSDIVNAVQTAKSAGFNMISDVMGVDYLNYPQHQGKRFSVIYNLYSITENERMFIRINVNDGDSVPTITGVWHGANFMEREVYDMYGITFENHPDLRKIITPEDLDGYPLRKDFPIGETPTVFNDGRFIDPAAFRAGLTGQDSGLSGHQGGMRKGYSADAPMPDAPKEA
ncbi:MAG: NADH-quinone oxidoreductase subunit C [Deinococcota bacterium]